MKKSILGPQWVKLTVLPFCVFVAITSCIQASSQTTSRLVAERTLFRTQPEYIEAEKQLEKENRKQFILGAINLCQGEDYEKTFGAESASSREAIAQKISAAYGTDNSWCYAYFIMHQMQNPFEYYSFIIENDQEILRNSSNPFKLREIRESSAYDSNVKRISKDAATIDPLALKHYSTGGNLQEYDFTKGEQKVHFSPILINGGMSISPSKKLPTSLSLKMDEQLVKEIFEFYDNGKPTKENGYKKNFHRRFNSINAIVTYELKAPTRKYSNNFEAVPIKVEFFDHKGWTNKTAEYYYEKKSNR